MFCGCEHTDHFDDEYSPQAAHDFGAVPAGKKRALYVGAVCDDCAAGHMSKYIYREDA